MFRLGTDFFRDSYTGDVDMLTGFALVATSQTCFVWQHTQVGVCCEFLASYVDI